MSLRKRIEESDFLADFIAGLAGRYLALCNRRIRWQVAGLDELKADLAKGPVLLVMWHSRSIMGALHWPVAYGPLSSLHASSPVGRVSGALQKRVGLLPMKMSRSRSNTSASRMILKRVRDGISIGMTGDGPLGPALAVQDAPLDWARVTGMPIYCYAFSARKHRRLKSWDRMMVPRPSGQGAYLFRRFPGTASRKMTPEALEQIREELRQFMDATTAAADAMAGAPPGP